MNTTLRRTIPVSVYSTLIATTVLLTGSPLIQAQSIWTGTDSPGNMNWSDANNWGGTVPVNYNSLTFSANGGTANNDIVGFAADGIYFGLSSFTLTGNSVLLSGNASGNLPGIISSTGNPQVVNLPLTLDYGYYMFIGPSQGCPLALNGTFTPGTNSIAYFDSGITTSSLTTDATGLIAGVGGQGLIFNGSSLPAAPSGLATVVGGSIVPYTGYATYAGTTSSPATTIPSGANNNIELTSGNPTAGNGFYTAVAGGTSVNTITVQQIGNSGGTATTTLTNYGALTFGSHGGIYVPDTGAGNKTCFVLTNGTMTAGTSGPATLTIIVNGNNANNEASIDTPIVNNAGAGPVSVIYGGTGSMNFAVTTASTYSGGLFVTSGQLQFGQPAQIGTGPVYVSSNATLYYTGTGAVANSFYLSPGTGSPTAEAVAQGGALAFAGSGTEVMSGTFHLLGNPVSQGTAGDRISGNLSTAQIANFTGQITGTGTLDFNINPHAAVFILANPAGNNNWQGGLFVEETLSNPSSARDIALKIANANNQIPHGAGAGNVTLYSAANAGGFVSGSFARLDMDSNNVIVNGLNGSFASGGLSTNVQIVNMGTGTSTLTCGDNNASGTFTGVSFDQTTSKLNLGKIGTGTETFSGILGHRGTTTVSNGDFVLASGASLPNSTTITVEPPATLDASGIGGLTVSASQTLDSTGAVIGNTTVNGTIQAFNGTIGTDVNTGNMTMNSGGSYIWDINKAGGTAGADPGWSLLNISGVLQINSTSGSPFVINVTSLTLSDAAGNVVDFNSGTTYNWIIASAAGGISGFSSSSQFSVVTTGFQNLPGNPSQWSVSVSGNNLVLTFNGFNVFATALPATPLVVDQFHNAVFTVTANSLGTSPSFSWYQNGNQLFDGGNSAGGNSGNVSIVTSGGGYTSTLTISGVDALVAGGDDGLISVTVNETSGGPQTGSSTETLTVIDPPTSPNVTASLQTQGLPGTPPVAGAVNILSSSASGTQPFTYQWYLNGVAISGATGSNYSVNIAATNTGAYTVVISNSAGNVTSSTTTITGPVSQVPNQLIFEPFNYPQSVSGGVDPARGGANTTSTPWAALGVTNVYNQATGVDTGWINTGSSYDFRMRVPDEMTDPSAIIPAWSGPARPLINPLDEFPAPGLASGYTWLGQQTPVIGSPTGYGDYGFGWDNPPGGNSSEGPNSTSDTNIYVDYGPVGSDLVTYSSSDVGGGSSQVNLPLGETITNGTVYCSMIVVNSGMTAAGSGVDYYMGFGNGSVTGTTIWAGLFIQGEAGSAPLPYQIGIFKGATASTVNPGVNGAWDPNTLSAGQVYLLVFRLNINHLGGSTCDMWIDPPSSSYFTNEANVPTPDVQGVAGSATDVAGGVSFFYMKTTTYPVSRDYTDLRIGTTWASVTPPAAPSLTVNSATISTCPGSSSAVFTSINSGNPVSTYQWFFNGSATPLTDGAKSDLSTISGSSTSTLTITDSTGAEVGSYTVKGVNTSPAPSDNTTGDQVYYGAGSGSVTYTGTATGTLSFLQPPLGIVSNGSGGSIISWPDTTPSCYALEQTTSLSAPISWTPVGITPTVVGGNYTVTVNPAVPTYYSLIAP